MDIINKAEARKLRELYSRILEAVKVLEEIEQNGNVMRDDYPHKSPGERRLDLEIELTSDLAMELAEVSETIDAYLA